MQQKVSTNRLTKGSQKKDSKVGYKVLWKILTSWRKTHKLNSHNVVTGYQIKTEQNTKAQAAYKGKQTRLW